MKASYFSLTPHRPLPSVPTHWPHPNELSDPEQSMASMRDALDLFEYADELGFDWVACAEHHFSASSLTPNPTVLAGALTQRVRRARIALLGSLIAINNPLRIAEEYAMLDNLSGGRLVAGLMRGAPYEYLVYNVNPAESRSRFEEAWELIVKAWTEPRPFGWHGEHYQLKAVSIWPRPVQQPFPPMFISGSSKDSGEFAARRRINLGLAFTNFQLASASAAFYRDKAAEYGWQPTADNVIYQAPIYVAETDAQAFADVGQYVFGAGDYISPIMQMNRLVVEAGFYGERDTTFTRRFQGEIAQDFAAGLQGQVDKGVMFCGSPDSIYRQLAQLRDVVGAGTVNLIFQQGALTTDMLRRSMRLFATEVLPRVRGL